MLDCQAIKLPTRLKPLASTLRTGNSCQLISRCEQIELGIKNTLKYGNNEYLTSFGMTIDTEMMKIDARRLPAPKVVFAGNATARGDDGAWNMKGHRLIKAPLLSSCAFIFFTRLDQKKAEEISATVKNL